MHNLDKNIIPVKTLLARPELAIPAYQRPYKWTQANLNALLNDLRYYRDRSAYRLGTVVFHHDSSDEEGERLYIVDGQQRSLTLMLLVKALMEHRIADLQREDVSQALNNLKEPVNAFLSRQKFSSDISHRNLHQNYRAAIRAVTRPDFTEADIDFLLNRCQLVTFVLTDVSEAFQFFDSQNARGRDLEPHDLLKAFHLREFSSKEASLKAQTVSHWENLDSDDLARLFANYLFRIRNWVQGKSAQIFSKAQTDLFKGVNLDQVDTYPYVELLRIAHHFVDDYNAQYQRHIDHQSMMFPFHLDQMVINGRRFFEMIGHYQHMISEVVSQEKHAQGDKPVSLLGAELDETAGRILCTLNSYRSRNRTGDKYIRTLFDCALIFYLDKFGTRQLSRAVEKLFVWAYSCRLKMQVVQLATMDNHALNHNVFECIKQSVKPEDFLTWPLETIKDSEVKGTRIGEIKALFRELKYYE